ncbi:MAG: rubrerythrin-like domain-containing protein [Haloferacaceae archaeon]
MRPNTNTIPSGLYECPQCGKRIDGPETRSCESCGGQLLHISRSRDL